MDSQMQTRFMNHILQFFAKPSSEGTTGPGDSHAGSSSADSDFPSSSCPDLPVLLGVMRAAGFAVKYSDKSEFGGTNNGCRAIIVCKRSGTRVVLDGEGPCTCPPDDAMKRFLDTASAANPTSRAPSPSPSTAGMLEDPFNTATIKETDEAGSEAPPGHLTGQLTRQKTWSRDDETPSSPGTGNRRLSAPPAPVQSSWSTLNGDELNVMAATDLLQEAMALLSGVKKVNLRNTPLAPTRRLSAMASRRASSDAFAVPLRPLSRTSSASSGLASSRSTSSLQSSHADTPRPIKPTPSTDAQKGVTLRRTVSASVGTTTPRTAAAAAAVRARSDASKKGAGETGATSARTLISRVPSLLKPPSAGAVKSSVRTPMRPGVKTNASLLSKCKTPQPTKLSPSPEVESAKL